MNFLQKLEKKILGRQSFHGSGNRLGTAEEERAQQEAKQKEAADAAAVATTAAEGRGGSDGSRGAAGRPPSAAAAAAAARMSSAASRGKSSSAPRHEAGPSSSAAAAAEPSQGLRGKQKISSLYPGLDIQQLKLAAREELKQWDGETLQALASVRGSADDAAGAAAVEMLAKILNNVINANEDNFYKVRKLRCNNPKLGTVLFNRNGSRELLELIGFELSQDSDGEAYMVLPEDDNLQKTKRALQMIGAEMGHAGGTQETAHRNTDASSQSHVDRNRAVDDGRAAVDHSFGGAEDVRVFTIPEESMLSQIELPDSFYDRSAQEIKNEYARTHQSNEMSKMLMTKAQREALKGKSRKKFFRCVVRIRFPKGYILQGTFRSSDKVELIHEFLNLAISPPGSTYSLHPPLSTASMAMAFKKAIKSLHQAGDLGKSFEECNLCPAAIFHFKFDELPDPSRSGPGLTDELLAIVEEL